MRFTLWACLLLGAAFVDAAPFYGSESTPTPGMRRCKPKSEAYGLPMSIPPALPSVSPEAKKEEVKQLEEQQPQSSPSPPPKVAQKIVAAPVVQQDPIPSGLVSVNPMPSGFGGQNSGIGSWFVADHHSSSTNGNSWCGYPYKDYSNGFAPDIRVMTDGTDATFFTNAAKWRESGRKWCGLEAIVTFNGKSRKMYIIDAFDHAWVRTPGSIDLMKNAFVDLFGRNTDDHNDVMQGVTWRLTGLRSTKYSFEGQGDP